MTPEVGTLWRRWVSGDGFVVEYVLVPDHPKITKTIIVLLEGHLDTPGYDDLLGEEVTHTVTNSSSPFNDGRMKPWTGRPTTYEEFNNS